MMSTLRTSWKSVLCGGVALGFGLGGCRVVTDLADLTESMGGDGNTSNPEAGGAPPMGSGGSDTAAQGGTTSEIGGTGGTSGTGSEVGGTGGTGGSECWDPTVVNFCNQFDCAPSSQPPLPTVEEVIQHYEDTGVCDEQTVMMETDNCGGIMLGYSTGYTAESYLFILGLLGATYLSNDTQFGPCNQFSYYGGITKEAWQAYGPCNVETRCVVTCGTGSPADPQYPPCRSDCQCDNVNPGSEPCSDEDSCECYCQKASVADSNP